MNKESLILDILEKTYNKLEELTSHVQEMKIEQTEQNGVVKEHERRSTASEARLSLLEKEFAPKEGRVYKIEADTSFIKNVVTVLVALGGIAVFLTKIFPSLFH